MNIPTTLKHKPVIAVEDYEAIDEHRFPGTDAKGLSLGLAQWNDRGKVDISAKVWRHTGRSGPGSRRSCPSTGCWTWPSSPVGPPSTSGRRPTAAPADTTRSIRSSTGWAPGGRHDGGGVHRHDHIDGDIALFQEALARDGELLGERMRVLSRLLKELGA